MDTSPKHLALPPEDEVLNKLVAWGQADPGIRALLLTSSRARPDGPVDVLSDYDVIVVVTDTGRFAHDDAWHAIYNPPLARWGDVGVLENFPTPFCGIVYADYVKIDYTFWPEALLEKMSTQPALPAELDAGYRVLLDKDGRTAGWPPPTYRAYIPARPTAEEYRALVEEFWWTATYVAKSLWRDELMLAKFCLDHEIKQGILRRLLEWRIELEHGWSVRPGVLGRGLKPSLPPDLWTAFTATYAGPDVQANWDAFFASIDLFRRLARETGAALGYSYPADLDHRATGYFEEIRRWTGPTSAAA